MNARAKDHYETLQVSTTAEPEVIEAAYRRLARKYHPDVNRDPTATSRMQAINAAYEILRDPVKRAQYDARIETGRGFRPPQRAWSRGGAQGSSPQQQAQERRFVRRRPRSRLALVMGIVFGVLGIILFAVWLTGGDDGSDSSGVQMNSAAPHASEALPIVPLVDPYYAELFSRAGETIKQNWNADLTGDGLAEAIFLAEAGNRQRVVVFDRKQAILSVSTSDAQVTMLPNGLQVKEPRGFSGELGSRTTDYIWVVDHFEARTPESQ